MDVQLLVGVIFRLTPIGLLPDVLCLIVAAPLVEWEDGDGGDNEGEGTTLNKTNYFILCNVFSFSAIDKSFQKMLIKILMTLIMLFVDYFQEGYDLKMTTSGWW